MLRRGVDGFDKISQIIFSQLNDNRRNELSQILSRLQKGFFEKLQEELQKKNWSLGTLNVDDETQLINSNDLRQSLYRNLDDNYTQCLPLLCLLHIENETKIKNKEEIKKNELFRKILERSIISLKVENIANRIKDKWRDGSLLKLAENYKPSTSDPEFIAWITENFFAGFDFCNENFFQALKDRIPRISAARALSTDSSKIVIPSLVCALETARRTQLALADAEKRPSSIVPAESATVEKSTLRESQSSDISKDGSNAARNTQVSDSLDNTVNENEECKKRSQILLNLREAFFSELGNWPLATETPIPNDEKNLIHVIVSKGRLASCIPEERRSNQELLLLYSLHVENIKNGKVIQNEEDELFGHALEYLIIVLKAENIVNLIKKNWNQLCEKGQRYNPSDPTLLSWITQQFFADINLLDNNFFDFLEMRVKIVFSVKNNGSIFDKDGIAQKGFFIALKNARNKQSEAERQATIIRNNTKTVTVLPTGAPKIHPNQIPKSYEASYSTAEAVAIVFSLGMYAFFRNVVERVEYQSTALAILTGIAGMLVPPVAMIVGIFSLFCPTKAEAEFEKNGERAKITNKA